MEQPPRPIYTADHYIVLNGKAEVGPGIAFVATDDADAWRIANRWSAFSSGVLVQEKYLRLCRDGIVIREHPLGEFN